MNTQRPYNSVRKFLQAVIAVMVLFFSLSVPALAVTKTYHGKEYSFRYPGTWIVAPQGAGMVIVQPKSNITKIGLADPATYFRIDIAHYENSLTFSDKQKTALNKSIKAMAVVYAQDWTDTFNALYPLYGKGNVILSQAVKGFRLNGNDAARVTTTEKMAGKTIVNEITFVSRNRKKIFYIEGIDSNGSVKPQQKVVNSIVDSFRIVK